MPRTRFLQAMIRNPVEIPMKFFMIEFREITRTSDLTSNVMQKLLTM